MIESYEFNYFRLKLFWSKAFNNFYWVIIKYAVWNRCQLSANSFNSQWFASNVGFSERIFPRETFRLAQHHLIIPDWMKSRLGMCQREVFFIINISMIREVGEWQKMARIKVPVTLSIDLFISHAWTIYRCIDI